MISENHNILLQKLEQAVNEEEKINLLIDIAKEVRNVEVERALSISNDVVTRSENIGYKLGIGRGLNLMGWCYWRIGEYDQGMEMLHEAAQIAEELHNEALKANVLNNIGYIYRDLGELATALSHFEEALAINTERGDQVSQAVNLTSIAHLNYDLGDYENALAFALKSLPTLQQDNDIHRLIALYHILGNIYFKLERYNDALKYFELNKNQTENGSIAYYMSNSGIGKVYYKMRRLDQAEHFLLYALKGAEELGDIEVQITCNFYLGYLHIDEEHYRSAKKCLEKAFSLSTEYSRGHDVMSVHEVLSILYEKMGDIPKAFHHIKEFERLKEEIFKQTTFNKLHNLQVRQQVELANKEKEVAERTANLKQQFMANMSHEIRTPMNAIVGMAALLQSKNPRPEQLRYINAIKQSADNLLVIINDILDLSKIEAGKIIIENTDFRFKDILQTVRDMLVIKAEEKGLALETNYDSQIPVWLNGDPTRIGQILINLVGNAIKFTEKGKVTVSAQLLNHNGKTNTIAIKVTDTGIGISQDHVNKIFESFTQAGTDTARKYGGTGLGLTISKELTTLMNGDIQVESELGKGTTFTVIIQLEAAALQEAVEDNKVMDELTQKLLNNASVLLVEDNEFNRMVAEDTLKEMLPDVTIDIAINGEIAVDKIRNTQYDIVLMDIQMPVMDGITATKMIRNTLPAPAKNIKIIAMTANVLQEDVKQYFEIGMNAYVSKPFKAEELLEKMAQLIAGKSTTEADVEPKAETNKKPLPERVTDDNFLKSFSGNNPEKMKKYINMFLENAPRLLAQIDEAYATKDMQAVKIAAHSLKPQLSYMGVKEEVSNVFLIEQTAADAHVERLPELIEHLKLVCEKAFKELEEI